MVNSCLYTGDVLHRRLAPVEHAFRYPVYFFGFDLDELPALDASTSLFGYNRVRPFAVHDRDYLSPDGGSIREKLLAFVRARGISESPRRILLVTCARFFHYVFNPVSFYFAFGASDEEPEWVVAEVNNTFGDRHLYVCSDLRREGDDAALTDKREKRFHVSPFFSREGEYRFGFSLAERSIDIRVDLWQNGAPVLEARWRGQSKPVEGRTLRQTLIRHPAAAALTMPRIMAQAARLYWQKKLPVHRRPEPDDPDTIVRRPASRVDRLARRWVLRVLQRVRTGRLDMIDPNGERTTVGDPAADPAILEVRAPRFYRRMLFGGSMAFGETFVDGDFTTPDLTRLLAFFLENRDAMSQSNSMLSAWTAVRDRLRHMGRRNSRAKSRHNIGQHYDLSNDFFRTWLDSSLCYSCGLHDPADTSLEEAQTRKLHRIIDLARLRPEHHLLEIGSGWGALAIEAARRVGCRVTSITISEQQYALARRRVEEAGVSDRVDIQFLDYRDLSGTYDRIISIEMLEAVGHEYFDSFFRTCDRVLQPDGLAVLQVITIPDHRYEAYRRGCDWIRKYIFPGGHLPSLTALCRSMTRVSRLQVEQSENIGPHYARTLRAWRERFLDQADVLRGMGYDDRFQRMWIYYLSYCEAGFAGRALNNLHLVLARDGVPCPDPAPTG